MSGWCRALKGAGPWRPGRGAEGERVFPAIADAGGAIASRAMIRLVRPQGRQENTLIQC